jgi:hypothetical protein
MSSSLINVLARHCEDDTASCPSVERERDGTGTGTGIASEQRREYAGG